MQREVAAVYRSLHLRLAVTPGGGIPHRSRLQAGIWDLTAERAEAWGKQQAARALFMLNS